eukprot:gene279-904_t
MCPQSIGRQIVQYNNIIPWPVLATAGEAMGAQQYMQSKAMVTFTNTIKYVKNRPISVCNSKQLPIKNTVVPEGVSKVYCLWSLMHEKRTQWSAVSKRAPFVSLVCYLGSIMTEKYSL